MIPIPTMNNLIQHQKECVLKKKETNPLEPPYRKCSICNDKKGKITNQYCLDNPKHPTYEERYDCWDGLTYLDCWGFIRFNKL